MIDCKAASICNDMVIMQMQNNIVIQNFILGKKGSFDNLGSIQKIGFAAEDKLYYYNNEYFAVKWCDS